MAIYQLKKESKEILAMMNVKHYNDKLICPTLKVLQMRHGKLDVEQAVHIIKEIVDSYRDIS